MSEIEQIDLWSTPIFVRQNDEHEFIKDELIALLNSLKNAQAEKIDSQVAPGAKHALHESKLDLLENPDNTLMSLKFLFEETILQCAGSLNHEFWPEDAEAAAHITESWFHITENGGFHDIHTHPNCSWCGIYAIEKAECDLDNKNGVNRFYDPRYGSEGYQDAGTLWINNNGFMDFAPQEGNIIIFPSYLKHSALAYFGKTHRMVIAFNAVVELY